MLKQIFILLLASTVTATLLSCCPKTTGVKSNPQVGRNPSSPKPPPGTAPQVVADSQFAGRLDQAKTLFSRGLGGDEKAVSRARELLESLDRERPGEVMVLAYLGSTLLLEAKNEGLPWKKGELCRQGLSLLDGAVEAAPENLEVRFVRGMSALPLPFFFGRGEGARADISWVAERAVGAAADGSLEPAVAAAALYQEGLLRNQQADPDGARASWRTAVTTAPDSFHGKAAAAKLSDLDG